MMRDDFPFMRIEQAVTLFQSGRDAFYRLVEIGDGD